MLRMSSMKSYLLHCLLLLTAMASVVRSTSVNAVTVDIGATVELNCGEGTNENTLSVEWERFDGFIVGQHEKLTLVGIQPEHLGKYICRVTEATRPKIVSKTVETVVISSSDVVKVTKRPSFDISGSAKNGVVSLLETQNLDIVCKVKNWPRNHYTIQWLNVDGDVVAEGGRLFLQSVLKNKHEGNYFCSVLYNKLDNAFFKEKVQVKIAIPQVKIVILPSEDLKHNGTIHRRCVGFKFEQSTERFSYQWFDPSGNFISELDTLKVPLINNSALGSYVCKFIALYTQKIYRATTNVNIVSSLRMIMKGPVVWIERDRSNFQMQERFSMKCRLDDRVKNVNFSWFKNDRKVSSEQSLVFDQFTKKDLGFYECVARGRDELDKSVELREWLTLTL